LTNIVEYCRWIPIIFRNLSDLYRLKGVYDLAKKNDEIIDVLDSLVKERTAERQRESQNQNEKLKKPPSNLNDFFSSFI
jgi:hypothetical protein